MKHLRHGLQACRRYRLQATLTQQGGVGQPSEVTTALVKIGGQVESLHG
jgi:hypothetical protein